MFSSSSSPSSLLTQNVWLFMEAWRIISLCGRGPHSTDDSKHLATVFLFVYCIVLTGTLCYSSSVAGLLPCETLFTVSDNSKLQQS